MIEFCKEKYLKYKEIVNYLIFGILTTAVNFIAYVILARLFNCNETLSNAIAWIISVIFAYVTNKIYVFNSNNYEKILKEMLSFIGCRMFSGLLDICLFYVFVNILKINDIISKILISVLVVVLNYIFSKIFIFKKNK